MRTNTPARVKPSDRPGDPVTDQLARLEDQLVELRGQVRQAQQLAGLGAAAATLAHEVSNLLTPIVAYADAVLNRGDVHLKDKALAVTLKNGRMLTAMAERMLHLSAAKEAKRETTGVRAVVESAFDSLCRDLKRDGITQTIDVDPQLTIIADALQVQQLLFNLLLNAQQALAKQHGGRLTVSAERVDDRVNITVADTAGGIEPHLLPHIFDPLRSTNVLGDNERARCRGLGLALCRDLAEENGGSINVQSEMGKGTRFTVSLPAGEPAIPST